MNSQAEQVLSSNQSECSDLGLDREKISAFVITYNEEKNITDCLKSISFCDDILIVDSHSKDRTCEIAEEYKARVIKRDWPGFKEQKSFGLNSTKHEWVLNLDADERVSDELREEILRVLREAKRNKESNFNNKNEVVGYYLSRVVFHLGKWWRKGGWYPEYRLRFFRKEFVVWGGVDPHEKPIITGKTSRLKGELLHYTYDNLCDQFNRLQQFSTIAARKDFEKGKKRVGLRLILINPVIRFFRFYFLKKGYREGMAGLIVAIAESYYTFMKYAKLWELKVDRDRSETLPKSSMNENE